MGMITTMMIYHDELDMLEKEPKQVCKKLYESLCDSGDNDIHIHTDKSSATLFKVKKTRHSSFAALFLQYGNTLIEVSPYSDEIKKLKNTHPELFKEVIGILENYLKDLKRL